MIASRSVMVMRRALCSRSSISRAQQSTDLPQRPSLIARRGFTQNQTPKNEHQNVEGGKKSPFDVDGKVFVVTGGGQGLGFSIAEGLGEAGGIIHVLDKSLEPTKAFEEARSRVGKVSGGSLEYHQTDVTDTELLGKTISEIAARKKRLDGLVAATAIQHISKAIDYQKSDVDRMLNVNYTGVFMTAQACAREMLKYKIEGSMCLVASMSGTIANRGLDAPIYNSSKAGVVQLARNLAMEFGRKRPDGSGGIRVNTLSPGHIMTPMVEENFRRGEANRAAWEDGNMLGRISGTEEYKSVALFMLSRASSYMTGHDLRIDGGTTAW